MPPIRQASRQSPQGAQQYAARGRRGVYPVCAQIPSFLRRRDLLLAIVVDGETGMLFIDAILVHVVELLVQIAPALPVKLGLCMRVEYEVEKRCPIAAR